MKYCIICIITAIAFAGCNAQPAHVYTKQPDENTLLWQISGNGLKQPSFLFGTFHLLCKDDIHFSAQLLDAVKQSNEIYMEMDMDDPATLLGGMMYMNMDSAKTLESLYTPADYKRVQQYFADTLHTTLTMFQRAKPYFLVALLYPRMMQCASPSGVEEELLKVAKQDKKEIQGLETIQFQASVFDSIPYSVQAKELLKNIDSFNLYKKEFEDVLNLYKAQKLDSLQDAAGGDDFGGAQYNDLLLKNRNIKWVKELKTIMNKESVFVAVGAGHLSGKDGLIDLLKKEGYKVEPLENKK